MDKTPKLALLVFLLVNAACVFTKLQGVEARKIVEHLEEKRIVNSQCRGPGDPACTYFCGFPAPCADGVCKCHEQDKASGKIGVKSQCAGDNNACIWFCGKAVPCIDGVCHCH